MRLQNTKAFTLVEIMIVIVILAIVAGMAIPAYNGTVERSRENEAVTNLNIIHMGEKIANINNGAFWGPGAPTVLQINTNLNVDISTQYYDITALGVAGTVYTATATRNNTAGGDGRFCTYSYDSVNPGAGIVKAGFCV